MCDNPITDTRSKPLTNLFRLQKAVVSSLSLDRVLDTVLAGAAEIAGGAPCALMLLQDSVDANSSGTGNGNLTGSRTDLADDRQRGLPGDVGTGEALVLHSTCGLETQGRVLIRQVPVQGSIFERALADGKPVLISEVPSAGLLLLDQERPSSRERIESLLCCPLVVKGKRFGLLNVYCPRDTHLTEETIELLWLFAGQAAIAIQNARLYKQFKSIHEYTRSLIDSSLDMVIAVDKDRKIVEFNRAAEQTFGYPREEVLGQQVDILYANPTEGLKVHRTAVQTGQYTDQIVNKRKNGETFFTFLSASLLRNAQGKMVGVMGVSRDITERKRIEEQLLQAQKMESIGTLAGGIAHDFNNLLTGIMGYAELALLQDNIAPRLAQEYFTSILEQGRRAATLVSQLLHFSRRDVVETTPLHLLDLVKETMKMLKRTIPENIDLELNVTGEIAMVQADPTHIQQVIMNLCVNASHSMPNGGVLTLGLKNATFDEAYCRQHAYAKPGRYACLSVRDTGMGMPPEVVEHIFEPFFTTKGAHEGTGLGLAMVYGIVKTHEGCINVYSEVGKGSEFKVYLPATEAATAQKIATEQPVGGVETLLLVEDNPTVLSVGREMLQSLGYTVLTATNGEEALKTYPMHQDEIALVLTDMIMPKMGGQELYERLTQISPKVKVLLASGYSLKEEVVGLRRRGLKGFVQKPFDLSKLAQAVRQALEGT